MNFDLDKKKFSFSSCYYFIGIIITMIIGGECGLAMSMIIGIFRRLVVVRLCWVVDITVAIEAIGQLVTTMFTNVTRGMITGSGPGSRSRS